MYNTWESWIFEYQGKNRVWNWSSGLALKIAMITSTVDSIDLGRIVNNFMPGKVTRDDQCISALTSSASSEYHGDTFLFPYFNEFQLVK